MWSLTPAEMNYATHNAHAQKVLSLHCKSAINRLKYFTYNTYLLAPLSRVLLENLTGSQLVKKFSAFYGTRSFITAFTTARHLSIPSHINPIHEPPFQIPEDPSKYYPPIYAWVFQVVSFLQISTPKSCMHLASPPYLLYASLILLGLINQIIFGEEYRSLRSAICSLLRPS